jgi:hypothetical protein
MLVSTSTPETNNSRQRCANCALGLETGQHPETVRGDYHRQRGVAARPGVLVRRAEKIASTQARNFLVFVNADGVGPMRRAQ